MKGGQYGCQASFPRLFFRARLDPTAIAVLTFASASLAATGTVYFDNDNNAAAGGTLFNGSFTGDYNVGLGRSVLPNLTTGQDNVAIAIGR
jgi:hypothetical protein